jgi:hypothetical protein
MFFFIKKRSILDEKLNSDFVFLDTLKSQWRNDLGVIYNLGFSPLLSSSSINIIEQAMPLR